MDSGLLHPSPILQYNKVSLTPVSLLHLLLLHPSQTIHRFCFYFFFFFFFFFFFNQYSLHPIGSTLGLYSQLTHTTAKVCMQRKSYSSILPKFNGASYQKPELSFYPLLIFNIQTSRIFETSRVIVYRFSTCQILYNPITVAKVSRRRMTFANQSVSQSASYRSGKANGFPKNLPAFFPPPPPRKLLYLIRSPEER